MNTYLELLAFYPSREPCLAVKVFRLRDLAEAITAARDWYSGGAARVQLSARLTDRRKVLLDWRSSAWNARAEATYDEAAGEVQLGLAKLFQHSW